MPPKMKLIDVMIESGRKNWIRFWRHVIREGQLWKIETNSMKWVFYSENKNYVYNLIVLWQRSEIGVLVKLSGEKFIELLYHQI